MSRRVLFVAYFYPPLANSGTQRPLKLANYLPDFGWEPLVLTVDAPPHPRFDDSLLNEVRPGTRITRVKMLSDRIGDVVTRPIAALTGNTSLSDSVSWRLRRHARLPDVYSLWRPTAVRAGVHLHRTVGFDAVWATGFPWTSLLVGRDISKRTGVPLVADLRDPWTIEDVVPISREELPEHQRLARSVFEQAAAVTSCLDLREQIRVFDMDPDTKRFVKIDNGFDRLDEHGAEQAAPAVPKIARLRVVYTGVLTKGYNLDTLYEAVSALAKSGTTPADIEIVAAGFPPGPARRFGVEDFVRELGPISHAAALGLMRTADILFLPGLPGMRRQICVPGKLYEYGAASRHILALADRGSEVHTFLNEIGGGLLVPPEDVDLLARTLSAAARREIRFPPFNPERLDQYDRKFLARKLAELLYKVTGSPAKELTELQPATQSC